MFTTTFWKRWRTEMKKNNIMKIILGIVISGVIIISIINGCKDCEKFFSFNFATGISLLFAACFSFYYVQKQADGRKQKELFIALLETFKKIIDDENNFDYSNVSKEQILMRKRDMSNKLEFIKKVGKRFSVEKDINFLEEKFSEYNEIIGNHIEDLETLCKMKQDITRPMNLMSQKVFELMINLYNW